MCARGPAGLAVARQAPTWLSSPSTAMTSCSSPSRWADKGRVRQIIHLWSCFLEVHRTCASLSGPPNDLPHLSLQQPEIQRVPLLELCLQIKTMGLGAPAVFLKKVDFSLNFSLLPACSMWLAIHVPVKTSQYSFVVDHSSLLPSNTLRPLSPPRLMPSRTQSRHCRRSVCTLVGIWLTSVIRVTTRYSPPEAVLLTCGLALLLALTALTAMGSSFFSPSLVDRWGHWTVGRSSLHSAGTSPLSLWMCASGRWAPHKRMANRP